MRTYSSLQAFIEATGTTQETLAHELGISQGYMSKLVRGLQQPRLDLALKIHDRYGVALDSLLKGPRTSRVA